MNKQAKNSEQTKAAAPLYQNHVRLVGFLGAAPVEHEHRAIFSVATNASWKAHDSGQWQQHTDWHRIVAWGELAQAVRSLTKGDYVQIDGELRSSCYDKELPVVGGGTTIVPMTSWEIRARAVRHLVRKKTPAQKTAKALKAAA